MKSANTWSLVSSAFYLAGGILFVVGSAYTIPDFMEGCKEKGCGFEIALWYFLGCLAYVVAAVIDLVLQTIVWIRHGGGARRISRFRLDSVTESQIAAVVYFIGSILFLVGSTLFFPVLDMIETARLVFRSGSFVYIFGSLYGIMQLVTPQPLWTHRRTMTLIQSTMPLSQVQDADDPESLEPPNIMRKESFLNPTEDDDLTTVSCKSIAVGLFVKIMFICGSSCFLTGGFLFQNGQFISGGYLWFIGSFFFTAGSTTSLGAMLKDKHCRRDLRQSASVVSTTSDETEPTTEEEIVSLDGLEAISAA